MPEHRHAVRFASYAAWFWLVARYPASRLAAFAFLTPVFGVAFGGLLLSEPIGPALLLALILMATGIYLVNRPSPPALSPVDPSQRAGSSRARGRSGDA